MKQCPVCERIYNDDTLRFCLTDGGALIAVYEPEATQVFPYHSPAPSMTTQQRSSPVIMYALVAFFSLAVGGGIVAYLNSRANDTSSSVTPTQTVKASPDTNTEKQTEEQKLRERLARLEGQMEGQKQGATNSTKQVSPVTPQSRTVALANSARDGYVGLRSEPSIETGYRILKIPHGSAVQVLSCQDSVLNVQNRKGRWCQVSYEGQHGWVFDGFLAY